MEKRTKIYWNTLNPSEMVDPLIPILLIDDNPVDNLINKRTLEFYGAFNITVINSAKVALEHLTQSKFKYHYIFVDLMMPIMDGFTFIDHFNYLKLDQKQGRLVILSVSLNPLDHSKAADLKIRFIEKPLTTNKLRFL